MVAPFRKMLYFLQCFVNHAMIFFKEIMRSGMHRNFRPFFLLLLLFCFQGIWCCLCGENVWRFGVVTVLGK